MAQPHRFLHFHDAQRGNDASPRGRPRARWLPALALLLPVGCGGEPVVLEVGPLGFTESEVRGLTDAQLATLGRLAALGLAVSEGRPDVLGGPILRERLREARIRRLREEVALERAEVSEAALRTHYEMAPERELEVRHLLILSERWRPEESREEARGRAEAARDRALAGEPFAELAGEVSEEPGAAERGGLLEPGREGTWVPEFWEAASRLAPGGISPVTETEYGFHVLRLENRREIPFEAARDRVASEIAEQVADDAAWEGWIEERIASAGLEPAGAAATDIEALLLELADARGIDVPAPRRAELQREWERTVEGWARLLGFEVDLPHTEVRERALAGLSAPGQNLRLARDELDRHAEGIDGAYPVRRREAGS